MHGKKKNYILQGGGVGGKEIELCIRKNYSTERGTRREGDPEGGGRGGGWNSLVRPL